MNNNVNVTNSLTEEEFYNIVEKHVVSPHKLPNREDLERNISNITPKDFDDWINKFN